MKNIIKIFTLFLMIFIFLGVTEKAWALTCYGVWARDGKTYSYNVTASATTGQWNFYNYNYGGIKYNVTVNTTGPGSGACESPTDFQLTMNWLYDSDVTWFLAQNVSTATHYLSCGNTHVFYRTIVSPPVESFILTYNANGGIGAPAAQSRVPGSVANLSTVRPTRVGYTFVGWNTNAAGTGTNYASGASYTMPASAVTLYAKWSQALSASCYGSPDPALRGSPVVWTSSATGGTGAYTYSWSGTDSLTGNGSTASKVYISTGTKTATVNVTSGTSTISVNCYGSIAGSPGGSGSCTSNCGINVEGDVCPNLVGIQGTVPPGQMIDGSGNCVDLPPDACLNIPDIQTTVPLDMIRDLAGDCYPATLSCYVDMISPTTNQVLINTNTIWGVYANSGGELSSGYTRNWSIKEGTNATTTDIGTRLNKIFTTIGLKTISVKVASTSGQIYTCSTNNSMATTSVILTGSVNEI